MVGQIIDATLTEMGIPFTLQRTHPACNNHVEVDHSVIVIRHPYDVAASRYRVRLSRSPEASGIIGLEAEIGEMYKHFLAIGDRYIDLRYEEFYVEYTPIFIWLEKIVGMIPSHIVHKVSHEYSLEANRQRAAQLADFNQCDQSGIHGDHIGGVVPGSWKHILPVEYHDFVVNACKALVEMFDYE